LHIQKFNARKNIRTIVVKFDCHFASQSGGTPARGGVADASA